MPQKIVNILIIENMFHLFKGQLCHWDKMCDI